MFFKEEKKIKTSVSMKPSVYKLISEIAKIKFPYADDGNAFVSMILEELVLVSADNHGVLLDKLSDKDKEVYLKLLPQAGSPGELIQVESIPSEPFESPVHIDKTRVVSVPLEPASLGLDPVLDEIFNKEAPKG